MNKPREFWIRLGACDHDCTEYRPELPDDTCELIHVREVLPDNEWQPIKTAPRDGTPHWRGLWVHKRTGKKYWSQMVGVEDNGTFVDMDYGDDFGWELDDFELWRPAELPNPPKSEDQDK